MLAGSRRPKNIAVFISGAGSTLQALLELQHQFSIKLVVANKKNILGILKAQRFGVPTIQFKKTDSYQELTKLLQNRNIDVLFLAGFMRILPADFVKQWQDQIFNIHPSLLPEFPGLNAAEKSHEANSEMGVTIHHVTDEMDKGKKFLQKQALEKKISEAIPMNQAICFLRRTEQHLLREFALRRGL